MRAADKVLTRDEIARRVASEKKSGKKIVFTCGVFDLLHVGHVRYLEFARSLGDLLIVGVNSDASVHRLDKGPSRPLVSEADRAEVVAALACVDYAFLFDETRPDASIRCIKPDIHVKDEAYKAAGLPEAQAVTEVGGSIVFAPHIEGKSTSSLVEKIGART